MHTHLNLRLAVGAVAALAAAALVALTVAPTASRAAWPGPDGKIAYVQGGDIWLVNPDGTGEQNLTNSPTSAESDPMWSPDGTKIVFVSDSPGNPHVFVMSADGTGQTQLTTDPGRDMSPSWSPDGTSIAFVHSSGVWSGDVFVMNANGTGLTQITHHVPGTLPYENTVRWSPDGTSFAVMRTLGAEISLVTMNVDGTNEQTLVGSGIAAYPGWSPDAAYLVYDWGSAGGTANVYTIERNGLNVRKLTNVAPAHVDDQGAYSPEGDRIVFTSDRDGVRSLFVMNSDGSDQHRIVTDNVGPDTSPDWGPQPINDTVAVSADVIESITISVAPTVSFGSVAMGLSYRHATPVSVRSNHAAGYVLQATRTAFSSGDMPLDVELSGSAPGTPTSPLPAATPVPIGSTVEIGRRAGITGSSGDVWPVRFVLGPVPVAASGVHAATVTFTAVPQ